MKGHFISVRTAAAAILASALTLTACFTVNAAASSVTGTNIHNNNYSRWSAPIASNIYENSDGSMTLVECVSNTVAVERYTKDGEFLETITKFDAPYSIFGGFYSGQKYNYLVFGSKNSNADDAVDVVFVRQYGKDWSFIRESAIKGIDTKTPFEAGSLRMVETNGILYIFTCHVMYSGHQANMTLLFNSETLEYLKRSTSPYSSHSFNQFIQTDGSYIYTLDHGDAYPRALMMGKYQAGTTSFYASTKELYNIVGTTGDNTTGVSVGGFLLSGDKFYIVGNSIIQDESTYQSDTHRNIFLMTTDKNMSAPTFTWLTNYTADDKISPYTPHLTKLDDGNYIVMWEEKDSASNLVTKIAKINSSGSIVKSAQTLAPLSDCPPLLCSDGKLRWYVTDSCAPIFYTLDPNTMETPKTPSEDWSIDSNGTLTVGGKGFLPSTIPWESRKAEIKHVIIKDGVYNLPANSFNGCTALEDAVLSDTVSSIGSSAFYGCSSLTSVKMPSYLSSLGGSAFYGCGKLTHLVIPEGVKTINSSTFYGCGSLDTVELPNTLETIGAMGFYSCGIRTLTLPPSLRTISYASFWSCSNLKTLTVPEGVTSIGSQAFAYSGLLHLALPSTAETLNSNMLNGRTSVNVYCIKGSAADDFMKNTGKEYSYIGDVSSNSTTDKADIKKILRLADGANSLNGDMALGFRADTNLDEKIDIFDVIRALNIAEDK